LRWRDKRKGKKSTDAKPEVIAPHTSSFHIKVAKTISTTSRKQRSM